MGTKETGEVYLNSEEYDSVCLARLGIFHLFWLEDISGVCPCGCSEKILPVLGEPSDASNI